MSIINSAIQFGPVKLRWFVIVVEGGRVGDARDLIGGLGGLVLSKVV